MKAKKKSKKKVVKRVATPKGTLVKHAAILRKITGGTLSKSFIARHCGYKSHNTVNHWLEKKMVPQEHVATLSNLFKIKA